MTLGADLAVEVLDLPALIELKELTGHAKDRAHLLPLRAALEERRKRTEE